MTQPDVEIGCCLPLASALRQTSTHMQH